MNEKIKQLVEESKLVAFVDGEPIIYTHDANRVERAEKFAELIIKECCSVLEPYDHRPVDMLKTHFGIE